MRRLQISRLFRQPTSSARHSVPSRVSWQRNLAVLWFGELIAISGFSVTQPFLPYYIQELGISQLEQIAFWAGLLTSAQSTTMALIAPVWGLLADRYGRKIMVTRAMFGGAIIIGLMGLTQNVYQLAVLRAIQGMLTGTVPAATTLVASSTPSERRGYALGILQMAIYLGSTVGPFLGGLIADSMGYRSTFYVTSAFLFAAGVLVTTLVREEFTPPEKRASEEDITRPQTKTPARAPRLWDDLSLVFMSRALIIVFSIRVLMRMGASIVGPVFSLFVQEIAPADARIASLSGIMTGIASATSAVAAILLGRASDRVGARRILWMCAAASCLFEGLQAWVQTPTQLMILKGLLGIAGGGILASASSLLAQFAPKNRFGAVYGVETSLNSGAAAIAPMIGAALTATWGLRSIFLGAALMEMIAAIMALIVVPQRSREPTTATSSK